MRHMSRGIRKMVSLDSRPPSIANGIIIGIGNLQRSKMRVLLNCSSQDTLLWGIDHKTVKRLGISICLILVVFPQFNGTKFSKLQF